MNPHRSIDSDIICRLTANNIASTAGGLFEDSFTVWLRDASGNALLSPGVMGPGDPVVLEVTPTFGIQTNQYTTTAPIPEPTTMLLLGSGLIGLVRFRRKFKKS